MKIDNKVIEKLNYIKVKIKDIISIDKESTNEQKQLGQTMNLLGQTIDKTLYNLVKVDLFVSFS